MSNNSVGNSSVSENSCESVVSAFEVCKTRFSQATSVKIVFLFRVSVTTSCSANSVLCSRFNAVDSSSRIFDPFAESPLNENFWKNLNLNETKNGIKNLLTFFVFLGLQIGLSILVACGRFLLLQWRIFMLEFRCIASIGR